MDLITLAQLLAIQAQNSDLQSQHNNKNQLSNLFPLLLERVIHDNESLVQTNCTGIKNYWQNDCKEE